MDTAQSKRLLMDTACILLAVFFSYLALGNAGRFHPDEAYYMTSARHAAINGDWLFLAEPIDKPPLTYYANALALVLFAIESDADGVLQLNPLKGEFAGRMVSLWASIILVAVLIRLARRLSLYHNAGWIAGFIIALSPLRIVFAPTAFTDMPMLLFAVLGLWMSMQRKPLWAGFWLILAFWAKPQVIFYVPLYLVLLLTSVTNKYFCTTNMISRKWLFYFGSAHRHSPTKYPLSRGEPVSSPAETQKTLSIAPVFKDYLLTSLSFVLPIIIGIGLLALWDSTRITNGIDSFFTLGRTRYTPTALTAISDYPQRLLLWWQTIQYLAGHAIITIAGLVLIVLSVRRYLSDGLSQLGWLCLWILAFVGVHMVLTLNLFDRNQLILLPIFVVLCAEGIAYLHENYRTGRTGWIALGLCLLVFAWQAVFGYYPIGSDDGRHAGIHHLAQTLNDKPVATVIYDTWLDWELDYYMGQWTDKRRVFYPTPELLIEDALTLDEVGTRYFVVPRGEDATAWLMALQEAGFDIAIDSAFTNFTLYSLQPPQ
ncbi:MAG: hypothetical protein AAFR81_05295 [Chloroflexota bacterium]